VVRVDDGDTMMMRGNNIKGRGVRATRDLLIALSISVPAFHCANVSPTRHYVMGDVNHDGVVDSKDAYDIEMYILDNTYPIDVVLADVSGDGSVSAYDAALILRQVEP
jgi:hypothetical protein